MYKIFTAQHSKGSVPRELLAALYFDLQHASEYTSTHTSARTHNKEKPALVGRVVSSLTD